MGAGQCPPTRIALAASSVWAEQGSGQSSGGSTLATPRRSMEEIGMDRLTRGVDQPGYGSVLTDHTIEQRG